MRKILESIRLQEGHDQLLLLQKTHLFFTFFALLFRLLQGEGILFHFLVLLLFVPYSYYYRKVLIHLYYTFWSFSLFYCLFLLSQILPPLLSSQSFDISFYLYFLALMLFSMKCYLCASPLYYARVSWWEYDFRYRGDLKILCRIEGKGLFSGRLTDLRRHAGCLVLFEDLDIGDEISFRLEDETEGLEFQAEILSKREPLIGRGLYYGIKFKHMSARKKKEFLTFSKNWRQSKKIRKRAKFGENS